MSFKKSRLLAALAVTGAVAIGAVYTPATQAFNFGDMMNPGKWMGGGNDYDDYDDYGPYGPPGLGGPYGPGPYGGGPYGGGPYGAGPYGSPGYGAPGYYGAPGRRPAPAPAAAPSTSSSSSSSQNVKSAEIEALRRRIEELESNQQPGYAAPPPADWGSPPSSAPPSSGWGSAPAFRPMDKY